MKLTYVDFHAEKLVRDKGGNNIILNNHEGFKGKQSKQNKYWKAFCVKVGRLCILLYTNISAHVTSKKTYSQSLAWWSPAPVCFPCRTTQLVSFLCVWFMS